MEDIFYGYIENKKLYGILYHKDDSLKKIIKDLGFSDSKRLFNQAKWVSPSHDMSVDEADFIGYDYPSYLFIELCRTKSIMETLKAQYSIIKFLNSRTNDPVFDGVLDDESEKELKQETKQELKKLKNAKVLELFNQAYKVGGDYKNAEKYFIVDFDDNRILETDSSIENIENTLQHDKDIEVIDKDLEQLSPNEKERAKEDSEKELNDTDYVGIQKGKVGFLVKLLKKKFNKMSKDIINKLETLSIEELNEIATNMFDLNNEKDLEELLLRLNHK